MKKIFLLLITTLVLFLSCTAESRVKYLGSARVQYNDAGYFELLFALSDSNKKPVTPEATVDISIVDNENNKLYTSQVKITKEDYGCWQSKAIQALGKNLEPLIKAAEKENPEFVKSLFEGETLACIRIDRNNITKGLSPTGTLHFTVSNENYFKFDEMSVPIFNLPVEEFKISMPKLPIKFAKYSKNFSLDSNYNVVEKKELSSAIEINDISISSEIRSFSNTAKLIFFGKKTVGKNRYDSDSFEYRLIDEEGYVAKTGMVILLDLKSGDKFKEEETIYDLKLGQTYKLEIFDRY